MTKNTEDISVDEVFPSLSQPSSLPEGWRSDPSKYLNKACWDGDLDTVKYILAGVKDDAQELEYLKEKFSTNLLWAVKNGHTDILTYFLDHWVDIGRILKYVSSNEDTESAIRVFEVLSQYGLVLSDFPDILHSWIDNETMLRYLLSKGANPNGLNEDDYFPLDLCSGTSIMKLLIENGADVTKVNLLHSSISLPNFSYSEDELEFILGTGVDINARAVYVGEAPPGSMAHHDGMERTGDGGTALHWIVRGWRLKGQPEVNRVTRAKWLLDRGARTDIEDDTGLKPVDYATDQLMIDLLNQYKPQDEGSGKSSKGVKESREGNEHKE